MPILEEQYMAYMLRFRRDSRARPWRMTLTNPPTGEQHSFADLEKLFQFLDERLAQLDEPDAGEDKGRPTNASPHSV